MVKKQRPSGWWYPWIFVAGFGVVFVVNGLLTYFATTTFNGLETSGAYEKGLAYNDEIAAAEAQAALGWTASFTAEGGPAPAPGVSLRPTQLALTMSDRDGRPVTGLSVTVTIRRPTVATMDVTVTLPATDAGTYGGTVVLPQAGQWEVRVIARRGDDVYRLRDRIFVR